MKSVDPSRFLMGINYRVGIFFFCANCKTDSVNYELIERVCLDREYLIIGCFKVAQAPVKRRVQLEHSTGLEGLSIMID